MNLSRSSKCVTTIAALAMAATGASILSQSNTDAATIATVHSGVTARLYTANGSLVNNRALGANTPWLVGKTANINGETMYQVSTNEYLRADDSTLSGNKAQPQTNKIVGRANSELKLYNRRTGSMANRDLAKGSSWQIGKSFINKDGQIFVQVSTDEYADANQMSFNQEFNPEQMDDFGVGNTFAGSSTDTNNDGNTNVTTPDTNNNQSGSSQESSTPDLTAVQNAVLDSINKERTANGGSPLTSDASLVQAANIRAKEVSEKFSHTRPNGTNAQTVLTEVENSSTYYGENLFGTYWDQLSVQTPEHYAYVVMDNFKGEDGTENHYINLMRTGYNKVGIGTYYASDGTLYVAEEFTK